MPVYQFSTITAAEAQAFNSATDELHFSGVTAVQVGVSVAGTTVTLSLAGKSVTFGPGFQTPLTDGFTTAGQLSFPDGSKMRIGTGASETLTGSPGADLLMGGDGNDTLSSGDGGDALSGGFGDDLLKPGDGTNTVDGGAGVDTLTYEDLSHGVTASLFPTAGGSSITGVEILIGSAFGDRLSGDGQANTISGGGGDDTLDGSFGDDTLDGGAGRDDLQGGDGADTLRGGVGQDALRGGAGADQFVFSTGDSSPAAPDVIADWSVEDRIVASPFGAYQETTAPDNGRAHAESLIAAGAGTVAVETPTGVILYIDTANNGGAAEDAILLSGRTLADISATNLGLMETRPQAPPPAGGPTTPPTTAVPASPVLPQAPTIVANGGFSARLQGNMDTAHLSNLLGRPINQATSTTLQIGNAPGPEMLLNGVGLTYDQNEQIVAGTATLFSFYDGAGFQAFVRDGAGISAVPFGRWVATDAVQEAFATILARNDSISSSGLGADLMRGYAGSDIIEGGGGSDTIYGGTGDDQIYAVVRGVAPSGLQPGSTYLRGDEGDDYIIGGTRFDDINGNMGNDTAAGGDGEDWVVGGKDNDLLFGNADYDLVYGNIGADTCDGGDGNDIVRGGQDNDLVFGGAGDDYVSGDKGDDTVVGGAGADIFHSFGDAGLDRVMDFSLAQGDRVQLDPGTQYTVSQVGADTVINMTGGGQMILVGVQMSTLTPGWIFGA